MRNPGQLCTLYICHVSQVNQQAADKTRPVVLTDQRLADSSLLDVNTPCLFIYISFSFSRHFYIIYLISFNLERLVGQTGSLKTLLIFEL